LGQPKVSEVPAKVDNLLPAEWMLLLRYFTSCGFVHHGFCQAAAAWLQFHEASGKLQLKQLQELLSSLAYAGHLTRELGEEVCKTLKPLPTEAEEQVQYDQHASFEMF
jgi:hypothetical protein